MNSHSLEKSKTQYKAPLNNVSCSRHQHRRPQQQHLAALAAESYVCAGAVERQYRRRRSEEGDGRRRGLGAYFLYQFDKGLGGVRASTLD